MKKNKKGFTLVELLAVLVVLIVIIVLAVIRVRKSVKDSMINSVRANAATLIKAVNENAGMSGVTGNFEDGIYFVDELYALGINVSGTKPNSGSIYLSNGEVKGACLKYDSYVYKSSGPRYKIDKDQTCMDAYTKDYSYTGEPQVFKAPEDNDYVIELWGADGSGNDFGGKGAYTKGTIHLNKGDKLYVYVGEKSTGKNATFNGGGSCKNDCTAGGGATDVRLTSGNWNDTTSLASRIMVAAGGGGYNSYGAGARGGAGGTLIGISGSGRTADVGPFGGTQISGGDINNTNTGENAGFNGTFGIGGNAGKWGGGAGGGYYGGAGGSNGPSTGGGETGGAGGSSYISGHTGCVAIKSQSLIEPKDGCTTGTTNNSCSIHYSTKKFTNTVMKAGNEVVPYYSGSNGEGHARITTDSVTLYLSDQIYKNFEYIGSTQSFIIPKKGKYKIEAWGAQGGEAIGREGGYGAYTTSTLNFDQGTEIFVNVGGMGESTQSAEAVVHKGGYNGGGNSKCDGSTAWGAGGGATSVALESGLLKDIPVSSLLVVAGAGGGGGTYNGSNNHGGHAGGISGSRGLGGCGGYGGTQLAGGSGCGGAAVAGSYGKGADTGNVTSGGGAGYYGGGTGYDSGSGGGGGSSYIAFNKTGFITGGTYCFNCTESSDPITKTTTTDCADKGAKTNCAKKENGYAKITYIP